jgi:fructokinase
MQCGRTSLGDNMRDHDLGGVYITDEYIDIGCGYDENSVDDDRDNLNIKTDDNRKFHRRIPFEGSVEETFARAAKAFKKMAPSLRAIGAGCYGPFLSLAKDHPDFGKIAALGPHRRMYGKNLCSLLERTIEAEYGRTFRPYIDTDVECAALGEAYFRYTKNGNWTSDPKGKGKSLLFFKVSKYGLGGAICQSANPYRGQFHSEMGQIVVAKWRDPWRDPTNDEARFPGIEPYTNRLESLASVEAIEERFGEAFEDIREDADHPAWHREAYYISQMCMNATAFFAPSNIVLGGRVMRVDGLLEKVRRQYRQMLGWRPYPDYPDALAENYIDHASGLFAEETENGQDGRPGLIGAIIGAGIRSRGEKADGAGGTPNRS